MDGALYEIVGQTTEQASIRRQWDEQEVGEKKISLNEIIRRWEAPLENVFSTEIKEEKNAEIGKESSVVH